MKIKLIQPLKAQEIENITKCTACTAKDATIHYIATHSSEVEPDTLFLALQGGNNHGENFRTEVLERGGFLLTEKIGERSFTVSSVFDALFALARAHIDSLCSLKHTIAITGSVGKTTTKEVLRIFLSQCFHTHATNGNQNSEIGTPLTMLSAPSNTEVLILEMGMNHKGEIARLSALAKPDYAIITNIGHAHIGNLGSRKAIAEAKMEILVGAKENAPIFIPAGEPMLAKLPNAKRIGLLSKEGDYAILPTADEEHIFLIDGKECMHIPKKIKDRGMLSAIAFSTAVATELGVSIRKIITSISQFVDNIFRQNNYLCREAEIVFDAYNASYESVLCAIEALISKPAQTRIFLFGDMRELGRHAEALHRAIGKKIATVKNQLDYLFLFGSYAPIVAEQAINDGFDKSHIFVNTKEDQPQITAYEILRYLKRGTYLHIKGARGLRMERILHILINHVGGNDNAG